MHFKHQYEFLFAFTEIVAVAKTKQKEKQKTNQMETAFNECLLKNWLPYLVVRANIVTLWLDGFREINDRSFAIASSYCAMHAMRANNPKHFTGT